ncbi:hypothetical protein MTO96_046002 [Rhipicephalus appendiculatus]
MQAGIKDCAYYCDYVRHNNTWLYGYYINGIYCWADDGDDENKTRILGLCLNGTCHPTDHDDVTHLPTPENEYLG